MKGVGSADPHARDENAPKLCRPDGFLERHVAPSHVTAALQAEGGGPSVAGKPGVGVGGNPVGNRSGTTGKGVDVALGAFWVVASVPGRATDVDRAVGIGDERVTGTALVSLHTIAAWAARNGIGIGHFLFRLREGVNGERPAGTWDGRDVQAEASVAPHLHRQREESPSFCREMGRIELLPVRSILPRPPSKSGGQASCPQTCSEARCRATCSPSRCKSAHTKVY